MAGAAMASRAAGVVMKAEPERRGEEAGRCNGNGTGIWGVVGASEELA
jgi:hypothetical protein